jgi:peptidoglycan/LPS O-acetylase OafA/YrhL
VRSSQRLIGLDGLRGIAILLVVIYHTWTCVSGQRVLPEGSLLTFLYAGSTGVTLFFVLSGFLVSLPFIKSLERGELYSLRRYTVQRSLRILPPYYAVGLIGILCMQQPEQVLPMLLFTANGYDLGYFSAVWWSLTTEIQFYMLVPLFFMAALSPWRKPVLLLLAVVAVLAYLAVICKWIGPEGAAGFELKYQLILSGIGQAPAFAIGLFLAFTHCRHKKSTLSRGASRITILGLFVTLGWVLLPAARMGPESYIWHAPWYVAPEALIWAAVIWVMLNREPSTVSLLDNRVTRYFGRISFSLYLVHMPVIQLILSQKQHLSLWLALLLVFVLSLMLAQLLFWLIESPFMVLKTKLSQPHILSGIKV